jgi:hypothetical protein
MIFILKQLNNKERMNELVGLNCINTTYTGFHEPRPQGYIVRKNLKTNWIVGPI